jgi:hypothetical protein
MLGALVLLTGAALFGAGPAGSQVPQPPNPEVERQIAIIERDIALLEQTKSQAVAHAVIQAIETFYRSPNGKQLTDLLTRLDALRKHRDSLATPDEGGSP